MTGDDLDGVRIARLFQATDHRTETTRSEFGQLRTHVTHIDHPLLDGSGWKQVAGHAAGVHVVDNGNRVHGRKGAVAVRVQEGAGGFTADQTLQ